MRQKLMVVFINIIYYENEINHIINKVIFLFSININQSIQFF